MRAAIPSALLLAALAPACASRGALPETRAGFATPRLHHLLDLEDARAPLTELEPFLRDPEPAVRARAALAAARCAGKDAAAFLRLAVRDPDPAVRESVALALGLTDDPDLAGDALQMARNPGAGPAEAAAAASAAVRLGSERCWKDEGFAALFTHADPAVRRAALRAAVMPSRGWKEKPAVLPRWIPAAIGDPATPPDARAAAVLVFRAFLPPKPPRSFATDPPEEALVLLTRLQSALREDPDPDVRAACALALGSLATGGTGGLDLRLAAEPVARVRVSLVRALGIIDDASVVHPLLDALAKDGDFTVRAAAAQALATRGGLDRDRAAEALFRASGRDASRLVRVDAVAALHALDGERAKKGIRRASKSKDPILRAASAGTLSPMEDLARLAHDPEIRVREAAVDAAGNRGREGLGVCVDALRDADPVVAATAAGHLGEMGAREAADLLAGVLKDHPAPRSFPDEEGDLRAAVLEALGKVDAAAARPFAEVGLGDPDPLVREAAAGILETLDGKRPAMPLPPRLLPFVERRDLRIADAGAPRLRFTTERGEFVVQTLPAAAPVHVARFLARVLAGGYDGTVFHRIVPNFVVQGGDPRGDGSGSGGAPTRQEFSGVFYGRGTLGVPRNSPPDSGGCQLFFSHGSTPHLDQRYTITGQVVEGVEVVDRIDLGDRILTARVE